MTALCIEPGDDPLHHFAMISVVDEDMELSLLRQRNRVLAALCGIEFDAEVELAAAVIQQRARRAMQQRAARRLRGAFRQLRLYAREMLASAALVALSFRKLFHYTIRERCAILLQSRARGMCVRARPAVRLLSKLNEERRRTVGLELSLLFLQKQHSKVRRPRVKARGCEWSSELGK